MMMSKQPANLKRYDWLAQNAHTLTGGQLSVALSLTKHVNHKTQTAYPGIATIEKHTGMTRNGVQKALRELEAKGVIRCVKKGGGKHKSAVYAVLPGIEYSIRGYAVSAPPNSIPTSPKQHTHVPDTAYPGMPEPLMNPVKEPSARPTAENSALVDRIWEAYPRKANRPEALTAITEAIAHVAVTKGIDHQGAGAYLLKQTKRYARERAAAAEAEPGADQYTPYPAKWFTGQNYLSVRAPKSGVRALSPEELDMFEKGCAA